MFQFQFKGKEMRKIRGQRSHRFKYGLSRQRQMYPVIADFPFYRYTYLKQ
jgi:hypothetical protein